MYIDVKVNGDKELILYLDKITSNMKPKLVEGLKEIGELIEKESKNKLGTYQKGWPLLKRATVIAKYYRRNLRNGIERPSLIKLISLATSISNDEPLILHGDLKKSINHEVDENELKTTIYSDNPYAGVQEFGYAPKKIPARSYLRLTLWDEENKIVSIISKKVGDSL